VSYAKDLAYRELYWRFYWRVAEESPGWWHNIADGRIVRSTNRSIYLRRNDEHGTVVPYRDPAAGWYGTAVRRI